MELPLVGEMAIAGSLPGEIHLHTLRNDLAAGRYGADQALALFGNAQGHVSEQIARSTAIPGLPHDATLHIVPIYQVDTLPVFAGWARIFVLIFPPLFSYA